MVFNATFNNISVISWRSVLLVEENHWPVVSHWQTLSHNVASSTPHHERVGITTLVVIGTSVTALWVAWWQKLDIGPDRYV